MRSIKKILVIIAAFLGIYSLMGFIVLPMALESILPDKLTQALNRPVRLAAIRFNPFALTLRIEGVDIREKNGSDPFVSFDALFVNVQAVSIFKMGLIINTLHLEKPIVHLARMDATKFNFSDLTGEGKPEASEKDKADPEAPSKPFRFAVRNIAVHQGSLFFRDAPMKKDHVISPIQFTLPLISNFEEDAATDADATLTAVLNDAKMSVDVKTQPFHDPLEAKINLSLTGIRLPYYFGYVPKDMTGVDVTAGLLDIRSQIHFLKKKKGTEVTVEGDIGFIDLAISDKAGAPVLTLPELRIAVAPSRPLENRIQLASVTLRKPSLFVNRSKEGVISLATLGPQSAQPTETGKPESAKPEAKESPEAGDAGPAAHEAKAKPSAPADPGKGFRLVVEKFSLDSGKVLFTDHAAGSANPNPVANPEAAPEISPEAPTEVSPEISSQIAIDDLNVVVSDFSIEPDKIARFDVKTRVDKEGNLSAAGRFGLFPLFVESDFTISDINLLLAQPYLPDSVKLKITDGRFSASGSAAVKTSDEGRVGATVTGKAAVNDFSLEPLTLAHSDVKNHGEQKSDISVTGTVSVFPLFVESEFAVSDIDLAWAQPYIPDNIKLNITDGLFSAAGNASVKTSDEGKVGVTVTGKAAVDDFASVDSQDQKAFVSWKSFSVDGLNVATDPLIIGMDKILLKEPKHRFVLYEPGVSSVSKVFSAPQAAAQTESAEVKPEDSGEKAPVIPITVGEVVLQNGDFQFTDKTVDPDYSTRLNLSEMRVTGLTSQQFKSATLVAEGRIDNDAPIKIEGTINPFKKDLFIELDVRLSNMELSPLSPYSGKFLGQTIGKGKLTTSVIFKIDQNTLSIKNQVLLDQFTLGRKVDSPGAIDLPLGMAIALLKDRSGRIDINLPVSGRTDDPQFGILKTVLDGFKKLIVKAATSPFDLVSGIVGGGEKLRYIEFDPGAETLNETGSEKIDAVAKLMFERPGLKMNLTGYVDVEKDREAMAAASVDRELKALKVEDQPKSGKHRPKPEDMDLTPAEYAHYVKELYTERVQADQDASLPIPEMAARLQAQMPASDQDLRKLAVERARQVKAAILQDSRLEAHRLFLNEAKTLAPKKIKTFSAGRVELGLK
ncbi:MAG: DUF748 domain-containing protein [Desulfosalsimonadaceae bacterium]